MVISLNHDLNESTNKEEQTTINVISPNKSPQPTANAGGRVQPLAY